MTIFAVIAPNGRSDLTAAVAKAFGADFMEYAPGQFVVSSPSLSAEGVTRAVGANGEVGELAVFAVVNWWGFHNRNLWEWLLARSGNP